MQDIHPELIFRDTEITVSFFEEYLRKKTNYLSMERLRHILSNSMYMHGPIFCDSAHLRQNSHHIKISSCKNTYVKISKRQVILFLTASQNFIQSKNKIFGLIVF